MIEYICDMCNDKIHFTKVYYLQMRGGGCGNLAIPRNDPIHVCGGCLSKFTIIQRMNPKEKIDDDFDDDTVSTLVYNEKKGYIKNDIK